MKKYATVLFLSLIWAAFHFSLGISNRAISPFVTGVIIRLSVGVLLTLVMLFGGKIKHLAVPRKYLPRLLLTGVLGFLLDITAFLGSRWGNVANGTVLLKTDILFVGILSAILLKQHFPKKDWGFAAVMFVGAALVLGLTPGNFQFAAADSLYILSALFISINAFGIQSLQRDGISNMVIAWYNNIVVTFFFISTTLISGVTGDFGTIGLNLAPALAVGIAGQFFIFILYYKSLRELPVWIVKVILLLVPVAALFYEFIFTGEPPAPIRLVGTGLVLMSALFLIFSKYKKISDTR
ncbi:MAG: DMT family transporter [Defluviitaleaceae bacterium]|nr:DMT family transporter [Defluviitaleaceae bacterium]